MGIWGFRQRETLLGKGRFHCLQCESEQGYKQYRPSLWCTCCWLPFRELRRHADVIRCCRCGSDFPVSVLDIQPADRFGELLHFVQNDLAGGTPIEMARTKLSNAGAEPELVSKLLEHASVGAKAHCVACDLSYVEGIQRCSMCGKPL